MATLYRRRHNLVKGTLGASLTNSGTSITFAAALTEYGVNVPTLGTGEYLVLVLDYDSTTGTDHEIVYLTAYTAGATSGTIERGKEGSTGVAHANGAKWAHVPTKEDSVAVAEAQTAGVTTDETTASGTFGDLTTSGPAVTVTIRASGLAVVVVSAHIYSASAAIRGAMSWSGGGHTAAFADSLIGANPAGVDIGASRVFLQTGITPGATTFTAKYSATDATTVHFRNRNIIVVPI